MQVQSSFEDTETERAGTGHISTETPYNYQLSSYTFSKLAMAVFTSRRSGTQGSNLNDVKPHGSWKFTLMDVVGKWLRVCSSICYGIAAHLEVV